MRFQPNKILIPSDLTPEERVAAYSKAYPNFPPLQVHNTPDGGKKISGVWEIGHLYTGSKYYGSYPGNLFKRIASMFDIESEKALHVFSGSLPAGNYYRFDGMPRGNGDHKFIQGDAAELYNHFVSDSVRMHAKMGVLLCDPPYSQLDVVKYGFEKLVNYKTVLAECWKVLEPNGWCLWLATRAPIYSNKYWRFGLIIPVYCGTNKIIRCLWGFQKVGG